MKQIKQYIVLLMMLLLLIACSKDNQPKEWINIISKTSSETYKIVNMDQIKVINDVVRDFKWQDKQIDTSGNSDYLFWLERENKKIRIRSYEIWFHEHDNSATIVEFIEGKFATINRHQLEQLIQLIESGHSTN